MFLESLGHEMDLVPSLDGKRLVNLGRSSSRLSKEEMSDLIESIFKEGAERGVEFHGEQAEKSRIHQGHEGPSL